MNVTTCTVDGQMTSLFRRHKNIVKRFFVSEFFFLKLSLLALTSCYFWPKIRIPRQKLLYIATWICLESQTLIKTWLPPKKREGTKIRHRYQKHSFACCFVSLFVLKERVHTALRAAGGSMQCRAHEVLFCDANRWRLEAALQNLHLSFLRAMLHKGRTKCIL